MKFLEKQSRNNADWETEIYWTGGKEVHGNWWWDKGDNLNQIGRLDIYSNCIYCGMHAVVLD